MSEGAPDSVVWDRILDVIRQHRRFVILLHVRPDGDSIGSSLALGRALRILGKEAALVTADEIPESLDFLPGIDGFVRPDQATGSFDVAIFLDCGDLDRTGAAKPLAESAGVRVNIDHHLSNTGFGDLNWIEENAGAVGEITWRLIQDLGVKPDREIAYGIYASLVTDTGSFGYSSTTPGTHRIAAELLELGVRPDEVARRVWEDRPEPALRILARALSGLTIEAGGRLAWVRLTHAELEAAGARPSQAEGLVNYPRSLRGVDVALSFVEDRPGNWRVSLRSNGRVDVAAIARQFGGGGHARAAGLTLEGDFDNVARQVRAVCRDALSAGGVAR